MKKHFRRTAAALTLLIACAIAHVSAADPAEDGFGLGFVVGQPSGISASLPTGPNNAFNLLAGYELSGPANVSILGDYVWHLRDLIPVEVGKVSFYAGPGVRLRVAKESEAGIRAVLGMDYLFEGTPLQALLELCPGINVVPNTRPNTTAGIGLRYFF